MKQFLCAQDLHLKDYALIEGFVQLPHKGPPKREVPEELENYQPPDVHALSSRLRKNDNSDLIPPWEPPVEEEPSEDELDAYERLLNDPNFEDMGPYTDPEVAKEFHSNDVELRHVESSGQTLLILSVV